MYLNTVQSCILLWTRRVLHNYLNATATDDPPPIKEVRNHNYTCTGWTIKIATLTTAPAEVATQNLWGKEANLNKSPCSLNSKIECKCKVNKVVTTRQDKHNGQDKTPTTPARRGCTLTSLQCNSTGGLLHSPPPCISQPLVASWASLQITFASEL